MRFEYYFGGLNSAIFGTLTITSFYSRGFKVRNLLSKFIIFRTTQKPVSPQNEWVKIKRDFHLAGTENVLENSFSRLVVCIPT